MANERLFELLSEAYAKPSKTYQALQEGFRGVIATADELEKYGDRKEKGRQRLLQQQPLSEVLGMHTPEGLEGLSVEQANNISRPVNAYADLLRAQREPKDKNERLQQANFLYNGKLMRFNPLTGSYEEAPVIPSNGSVPSTGDPIITPRVEPTVPAGEVSKSAELEKLLQDVPTIRQTYSKDFVGPLDSPLTNVKQRFGKGATPEAAVFKSTVAGMRNKVLNLLSGAAISPAEGARLMQQLPNENMSEIDFNARLGNFERDLQNMIAERKRGFSGAGYRGMASSSSASPVNTGGPSFRKTYQKTAVNAQGIRIGTNDNWATFEPVKQ